MSPRHCWLFAVIVLVLVVIQECLSHFAHTSHQSSQGGWTKLNHRALCVGAKNDKYDDFRYHGADRFLGAVKLVHLRGRVRCRPSVVYNSNWGCARGVRYTLNMFVTDNRNRVIFPHEKYLSTGDGGKWFGIPGFNEISPTLVMSDFGTPFYLSRNQHLRIWYGEDLYDYHEMDNEGRVCMDVYGYFI